MWAPILNSFSREIEYSGLQFITESYGAVYFTINNKISRQNNLSNYSPPPISEFPLKTHLQIITPIEKVYSFYTVSFQSTERKSRMQGIGRYS